LIVVFAVGACYSEVVVIVSLSSQLVFILWCNMNQKYQNFQNVDVARGILKGLAIIILVMLLESGLSLLLVCACFAKFGALKTKHSYQNK
jgi:hypothetical protein